MTVDMSAVTISVTKPKRKPAALLAEMGIRIKPVGEDEDEGNVDRYFLGKRVAAERRTGGGFLMGIQDKTLFTSAIYLREHFRVPILIVEGQVNYEYSRFDPQAVRGAMSSMMLLFDQPVELLARQHHIYTDHQRDRHVVDLIFRDVEADELLLVELKRGELMPAHHGQIRRYLDNADKSKLLRSHLARGVSIRGVLATIVPGRWKPKLHDVSVRIVDGRKVVEVLKRLRAQRLAREDAAQ